MAENETAIYGAIIKAVNRIPGCVAWRNSVGNRGKMSFGLGKGSADIIACLAGRFVGLEVKLRPANKAGEPAEKHFSEARWKQLSADQRKWFVRVVDCGGIAEVVWSVDEAMRVVMHVLACGKLGVRA